MKTKGIVSYMLAILLLFNLLSSPLSFANTENLSITQVESLINNVKEDTISIEVLSGHTIIELSPEKFAEYEPKVAPVGIAIFVGGILVGYLIDGYIIYETGHSAGYWVAHAIEWASQGLGAIKNFFINSNTSTKVSYATNATGCVQRFPGGPWLCPTGISP